MIAHASIGCTHPRDRARFLGVIHCDDGRTLVAGACMCGRVLLVDPAHDIGEHDVQRGQHAVEGVTVGDRDHADTARTSAHFGGGSE